MDVLFECTDMTKEEIDDLDRERLSESDVANIKILYLYLFMVKNKAANIGVHLACLEETADNVSLKEFERIIINLSSP